MVPAAPSIRPIRVLPEDIDVLLAASNADGFELVSRLVGGWRDGSNRFDETGEILMEARMGWNLVAIGGLNRDPYIPDAGVGRLRHLYVLPDARGSGVGRSLVLALIEHARLHFSRVRLRASPPAAGAFYLALGFNETPDEADSTHEMRL